MNERPSGFEREDSFVEPFRHALNRMQEREFLSAEQHVERAGRLLAERFETTEARIATGFSYGVLGVLADHTHYFDGFALLKPMHQGVAVAARASIQPGLTIAREGIPGTVRLEFPVRRDDTGPDANRVIARLAASQAPEGQTGIEIAVVETVPEHLEISYLASVAMATVLAMEMLGDTANPDEDRIRKACSAIEDVMGFSFSPAYVAGALVGRPGSFLLADARTLEHIPLETPSRSAPDWAVVDTATGQRAPGRDGRIRMVTEITTRLQDRKFSGLTSLRDLEHRNLAEAMDLLPRRHRPALRSLVSENRRVQRMVAAIRNHDWQLMGAHLLMSHASRRSGWMQTTALQDFVVDASERFSLEGVYGAARTGEGPYVLIAGQPFRLPAFLDYLRSNWPDQASDGPETLIL